MKLRIAVAAMAVVSLAAAPSALAKGTVYSTGNSNELQSKTILGRRHAWASHDRAHDGAVTPRGIAITPNGQFLYMTTAGANVLGFNIRGHFRHRFPGSPYNVTDTGGYGLAVNPSGTFVYTSEPERRRGLGLDLLDQQLAPAR